MNALEFHEKYRGKIEIQSRVPVGTDDDLKVAYTPGVAEPSLAIHKDTTLVNKYTNRWNSVAIVSDGSAVLGLGNIGPEAAMPVMEGKAVLFKAFGGVDAYPVCLRSGSTEELISHIKAIEPTFGGINLEDIAAPACFEVEKELKKTLDIPVFHDDQHGTAVVVLAGLINACLLTGKPLEDLSIAINGAGAAGIAITRLLIDYGIKDIVVCDSKGAIYGRRKDLAGEKKAIAEITNAKKQKGSLGDIISDRTVFIGVSTGGILSKDMVKNMGKEPVIFAMANPVPEIFPAEALESGAAVVATGRSDFPNQINNVLAFPGIFRALLDVEAADVSTGMKIAAAEAIAKLAQADGINIQYIIPKATDLRVGPEIAGAVAEEATRSGLARKPASGAEIRDRTRKMLSMV